MYFEDLSFVLVEDVGNHPYYLMEDKKAVLLHNQLHLLHYLPNSVRCQSECYE